jgi:hypothetical protein
MRAEDRVRLQHMIDAAEAAIRFVKGRQRADLDRDQMAASSYKKGFLSKPSVAPGPSDRERPTRASTADHERTLHADVFTHSAPPNLGPGCSARSTPLPTRRKTNEHAEELAN